MMMYLRVSQGILKKTKKLLTSSLLIKPHHRSTLTPKVKDNEASFNVLLSRVYYASAYGEIHPFIYALCPPVNRWVVANEI